MNQQQPDLDILPAIRSIRSPNPLTAPVWDDSAQWIAWNAAQSAWLESKRRRSESSTGNTTRAYTLAVHQFFDFVQRPPWQISPADAHAWAASITAQGLTPATLALKLAALSSFYDFVQRRYTVTSPDGRSLTLWPADRANPFFTVERPQLSPYSRAVYPTTDDLQAILSAINTNCLTGKRDFALLYTIATTCRRSSEVLNLRWRDIRPGADGNYQFSYVYKGGKPRRAVLHHTAHAAICAYLTAAGRPPDEITPDEYIWLPLNPDRVQHLPSWQRAHPDTLPAAQPLSNHQANSILRKYAKRAGVDLEKAHIHGLRHAGARLRYQQMKAGGRVDFMEIKDLLGHSSLAVTQIYVDVVLGDPQDPGADQAAAALLPKGPRRSRRAPATQERLL